MHPLDNVIWQALTTRQREFAESSGKASRFTAEVSSLAGFEEPSPEGYQSLAALLTSQETVRLFLADAHQHRAGWNLVTSAPLLQMVCENGETAPTSQVASDLELLELSAENSPEMLELAMLAKPGPFNRRTRELGTYLGMRHEGKLVAMAGERLKVPGYTEVSAVCTHPEHTGHGYAARLMSAVMRRIRKRSETPFLHVRGDNARAIALYERLGFETRVRGHLAVLRREKDHRG